MAVPKAWNGSTFDKNPFLRFKVWTGSAWAYCRVRIWNGSVWYDEDYIPPSDSQTVTNGVYSDKFGNSYGFLSGVAGSISDGTSNLYSGAAITALYYYDATATIYFSVSGSPANSGWTKMTIAGVDYMRSSASFSSGTWSWSAGSNPFSSFGSNVVATFS